MKQKPRRSQSNKAKLMLTRAGVLEKPRVRKRKKKKR